MSDLVLTCILFQSCQRPKVSHILKSHRIYKLKLRLQLINSDLTADFAPGSFEEKHAITSSILTASNPGQLASDSSPKVHMGKLNLSLYTYEHTNTTGDCFCLQGLQVIHRRLVSVLLRDVHRCVQRVYTQEAMVDTDVCGWLGGRREVWVICRRPNLTLSAARWAVFAEIKHISKRR